jgi:hypothetical protein
MPNKKSALMSQPAAGRPQKEPTQYPWTLVRQYREQIKALKEELYRVKNAKRWKPHYRVACRHCQKETAMGARNCCVRKVRPEKPTTTKGK